MAKTVEQFAHDVVASGILAAEDLEQFQAAQTTAGEEIGDAQALARLLVRHGKLTKYQAAAIYQGKAKGLVLGNYVLLDKLGAGGMGQVFKALHKRMERVVALKVLPAEATKSPANIQRFQREVKAAARLVHPNIVVAHDADEADGTHFLVMEYVEGKDLSAIVKQHGPLPVAQAVECVRQAALGLSYAHKRGVIHRDIKPANLLVDDEGTVKILDMGLARLEGQLAEAANIAALTQSGQVMGTVDYMSPEQAEETRGVDARADQYSLGCTLWVLLTGRPMFSGTTTIAKLMAHRTQPAPSLRAARADVPEALEDTYQRMVAKEPDDRFASMDEVIAALAQCVAHAPPVEVGKPSSSDSQLTEFFHRIAGDKPPHTTRAPTTPAIDAETIDRQPVKEDTGTSVGTGGLAGSSVVPSIAKPPRAGLPAADSQPAPPKAAARRNLRPLLIVGNIAGGGLVGLGMLAALLIWLISPGSQHETAPSGDSVSHVASGDTQQPPLAIAPFDAKQARAHQEAWANYLGLPVEKEIDLPGGVKLTMVLVPPGEFLMGSTDEERAKYSGEAKAAGDQLAIDRIPTEGPQHRVQIAKPFYLGKHELTQAQWQAVMGNNPSRIKDTPLHPVENVSWEELLPLLVKLNDQHAPAGMKFVLPTEAQWEYACRAGMTTFWYYGDNEEALREYAWFNPNAGYGTHPVGQLRSNGWGLYDMHGNVWEWCADWYSNDYYAQSPLEDPSGSSEGSNRVHRGGSYSDSSGNCRSAIRMNFAPGHDHGDGHLGFRLAATIDTAKIERGAPPTNYALDFNGTDAHVVLPAVFDYDRDDVLTLECYVTPRPGMSTVASFAGGKAGNASIRLGTLTPKAEYVRWHAAIIGPRKVFATHTLAEVAMGKRVHVAAVFDRGDIRIYLDGKLAEVDRTARDAQVAHLSLLGMGRARGKAFYFNGQIDELRLSRVARYDNDFTPAPRFTPDTNTLVLYHCDEGAGDVLRDSSSNNHHGKVVGAKWVSASGGRESPESAQSPAVAPFDAAQASAHQEAWAKYLDVQVEETNGAGMKMVVIPPGQFTMGRSTRDEELFAREKLAGDDLPAHEVAISAAFAIASTEVTQRQWKDVMGTTPWSGKKQAVDDDDRPATYVSWNDAVEFCRRLSTREGAAYRLPTEAEWEWACRAGSTTAFGFGDDAKDLPQYAWTRGNSQDQPQPVAQKWTNAWGLHDMHGNAWEWTEDPFGPYAAKPVTDPRGQKISDERTLRGGCFWSVPTSDYRSSARRPWPAVLGYSESGFRPIRILDSPGVLTQTARTITPNDGMIDLLPLVDVARDKVVGVWEKEAAALHLRTKQGNQIEQFSRMALPVVPAHGSAYHVRVKFTALQDGRGMGLILPIGDRQAMAGVAVVGGLGLVDGKQIGAQGNPTICHPQLRAGTDYTLDVWVRPTGDEVEVEAQLDGSALFRWQGKIASLALHDDWAMPRSDVLAVCEWSLVPFTVRQLQLEFLSGEAKAETAKEQ